MGRLFVVTLDDGRVYSCKHCKTNFAYANQIISKGYCNVPSAGEEKKLNRLFTANMGRLISLISVNVIVGEKEDRMMMTGMHTVVDIFCVGCGSIVGWKYEAAHEKAQQYKEGKFILERFKVLGPDGSTYVNQDIRAGGGNDGDDA